MLCPLFLYADFEPLRPLDKFGRFAIIHLDSFSEHGASRALQKRKEDTKMKTLTSLVWALLSLFGVTAQAAYIDTATCNNSAGCGYYLPYEGRLAGFVNWELNGAPVLAMSVDQTIHAPTAPGTPVTLYTVEDMVAAINNNTPIGNLGDPAIYNQIGFLMWAFTDSSNTIFDVDGVNPPTVCTHPSGDAYCAELAAYANAAVWNMAQPGSVPMPTEPWPPELSGWSDVGASIDFNWVDGTTNVPLFMEIEGGDSFVILLGGANSETLIAHTPIPASTWLFGSGLLGLVAVSRRRTNWA